MSDENIKNRIDWLIKKINHHNFLYYVKNNPEISDEEYDALLIELQKLEQKYPQFKRQDSPTTKIGSDLTNKFEKVEHKIPVLSLDKVYSLPGLKEWAYKIISQHSKVNFIAELKYDGSSIVLYYKKGILYKGVTRGNGLVGNDVTQNIKTIKTIPLKLNEKIDLSVRGEVLIKKDDFQKYNKNFDNFYSNPRNFAAGTLNRIKSKEVAKIPLIFIAYDGFSDEMMFKNDLQMRMFLSKSGFYTGVKLFYVKSELKSIKQEKIIKNNNIGVENIKNNGFEKLNIEKTDIENLEKIIKSFDKIRKEGNFPIDGIVFKVNEYFIREQLGSTAHHPKWAIAFKFEAPKTVTKVKSIELQIGRGGRITPIAILEPVKLAGSTISKATLHNEDYIKSLELSVGDTVTISKRGDVIPAVEEVIEKNILNNQTFTFPDNCPFCGKPLVKIGPLYFCNNRDCKAKKIEKIKYFVSKNGMNITNLGDETITFLYENGFIEDPADLYFIDYERLKKFEGFKEKKINLIRTGIEQSKNRDFITVLTSLGIKELGKQTAKLLVENGFKSIDDIIKKCKNHDLDSFIQIPGIGPKMTEIFIKEFTDNENLKLIEKLKNAGLKFSVEKKVETKDDFLLAILKDSSFINILKKNKIDPKKITKQDILKVRKKIENTRWVITGSFENFRPREKAAELIEKLGGKVSSSVSSKTDFLLAGENPGSKFEKAKRLKIKIIDEEQFINMLSLRREKNLNEYKNGILKNSNSILNNKNKKGLDNNYDLFSD